jgi:hypothetical protein
MSRESGDVQFASDLFMTGHGSWLLAFFQSIFMTAVLASVSAFTDLYGVRCELAWLFQQP